MRLIELACQLLYPLSAAGAVAALRHLLRGRPHSL